MNRTMHYLTRTVTLCGTVVIAMYLGGNTGCATTNGGGRDPDTPPDPGEVYQEGLDILAAGEESGRLDYKKSFEKFSEACRLGEEANSPHVNACFNAGVAAVHLGRNDEATRFYRRALTADPGFKPAMQNLTVSLLDVDRATEALPIYEEYLAKNPKDAEVVNNYAGALAAAGMYDRGVEAIQGLLFEDPENTRAYKTLARIYFLQGSYRMSQMASANALKLDPDDADIHNNIGLTFLKDHKEAEAVVAFKAALKLDPDNLEANMNLGLIAVRAADYPLAAQSFQKVLTDFPGNAEARIGMAVAYRGSLEFDSAVDEYNSILETDSCHEMALLNKALVQFLFKKEYKKSVATYDAYSKCYPDNDVSDLVTKVQYEISEQERYAAELAELERQLAELEEKAKVKKVVLEKAIERSQRVFVKYAEVEQDPSWFEVYQMQAEAVIFAIESEDFFFMEEQAQYLDEFMVAYYADALEIDPEEWTGGGEIVIENEVPEGEGGEGAPEGEGGEGAPDGGDGTEGELPAEGGDTEGAEPAESAEPAEGGDTAEPAPEEGAEGDPAPEGQQ